MALGRNGEAVMFRSTPPREGRLGVKPYPWNVRIVSIHAPTRGATIRAIAIAAALKFRSTPPREGRLSFPGGTASVAYPSGQDRGEFTFGP